MASPSDQAPSTDPTQVPVAKIEHDNSALEEFVEQHKSKLILGSLAALVIIIGYLALSYMKESGASKAAAALTGAESVEDLRKVVTDFPNSVVAGSAELLIADKLQEEGKADESYTALEAFVNSRKEHPLYYKGLSDLGLKEHMKGKLDDAITKLKEAATPGTAPGFIEQTALIRLGDALTAKGLEAMANKDVDKAKSFFDEAGVAYGDLETRGGENSPLSRTATQRKERLPHLSIAPITPDEAKAAAEAAAPPAAEVTEIPAIELGAPPAEEA
jgi:predicted negative regulator of RcsB-dependent stress response